MTRNYIQVGAGGTGSFLFPALIRYLETYKKSSGEDYLVTLIDGKEISAPKLDRQLFASRFAGDNKAAALIQQHDADPEIVMAIPEYLGDSNIGGIHSGDVVLIAADNFPVRARIEMHCQTLRDSTVLNGGNEMHDGSLQIWMRRNGEDITPPLSQGHPEILRPDRDDPAALSCQQIAELPSGEQTIIANMMSATAMLNGLRAVHDWERAQDTPTPEEIFWDLKTFAMRADKRPPSIEAH